MYSEDMFREGIPLTSRKFHRILDFYLFHCPVDGTSVRATTFEQQGWKGTLFSTLKRNAGTRFFFPKKLLLSMHQSRA